MPTSLLFTGMEFKHYFHSCPCCHNPNAPFFSSTNIEGSPTPILCLGRPILSKMQRQSHRAPCLPLSVLLLNPTSDILADHTTIIPHHKHPSVFPHLKLPALNPVGCRAIVARMPHPNAHSVWHSLAGKLERCLLAIECCIQHLHINRR